MLKFFRQIRQKLLTENRFSKYLIYAIGEIFLVVIGILIALQINNWNEAQKNKQEERQALLDLKYEFETNKEHFLTHSKWQEKTEQLWLSYLTTVSNTDLPDAERAIERPQIGSATFKISNSKLNSLLATGVIDKIKNDSLKQKLLSWNEILLRYQDLEKEHTLHSKEIFIPYEIGLKPNATLSKISGVNTSFHSAEALEQISINAIKDMKYQNILLLNHHWLKLKVRQQATINQYLDGVIEALQQELDR